MSDRGLASAPDETVLALAATEGRILVSADTDFGTLLARTGATRPSVILFRRSRERRPEQQAALLLKLRLGGMATALETRLLQAQAEKLAPIDIVSALVSDELLRRSDRLIERPIKQAGFRDPNKTLDAFNFDFRRVAFWMCLSHAGELTCGG